MTGKRPRTLKELVLADLERAQRLIERMGDEIEPPFRIASPEGDYWIAMTLPADNRRRADQMAALSDFMAWKLSPGFVMAAEIAEPEAVYAMGVTIRGDVEAAIAMTHRNPLRFGEVTWLDREDIGNDPLSLLPRGARELSQERLQELDLWFGPQGLFPAMRIAAES